MKRRETLSKGEELLARILDECLDEDLSFVPPEREIARKHRFSEKFEQEMEKLLAQFSNSVREEEIQKHFSPRYGQWAACILVFCICGGLFYYMMGPLGSADSSKSTASVTTEASDVSASGSAAETAEEAAGEEAAEVAEAEAADEGTAKEAGHENVDDLLSSSGSAPAQQTVYCGQTVYLAKQQEVPEELEVVTTLVNCPVLDEENPILVLTIGNIGDEDIQYLNRYDMEVWIDGGWYVVKAKTQKEGQWQTLQAGMAVDEEIDLSEYRIDYDAEKYRLITYVDSELISAEFTFKEVFTEMMEDLEEE